MKVTQGGSENFCIPIPLCRAPRVYHVSMVDDFSFNLTNFGQSPAPPEQHAELSHHRHGHYNPTCHHLVFTSSDDESSMRSRQWHSPPSSANARSQTPREADVSSTVHHITPTTDPFLNETWDGDSSSFDEHFPTAPLDDDVWAEEQILDKCLWIQERPDEPNHQCSYPFPYDGSTTFQLDLLQSIPQNEAVFNYNLMDFSDISSDLPYIITATSDTNIPELDIVFDAAWFT